MQLEIRTVIYFYMAICLALLAFNILYIVGRKGRNLRADLETDSWERQIRGQILRIQRDLPSSKEHRHRLSRRLKDVDSLLAYGTALGRLGKEQEYWVDRYVRDNIEILQQEAMAYVRRDSMERAYFAYLISQHHPFRGDEYRPILDVLLAYLDRSTIYCKENVLKALYALGNIQAVENALQRLNDEGWFHHPKLLGDGLLTFAGDRGALAARLWTHYGSWDDGILLAVVSLMTGLGGEYAGVLLPVLKDEGASLEIRLAILRYFRRYPSDEAYEVMLGFMEDPACVDTLKIVSASVLERYPGSRTVNVLKDALHSHNWYVRYNAASSIRGLGVPLEELEDIYAGNDRYARDILRYLLEEEKKEATVS